MEKKLKEIEDRLICFEAWVKEMKKLVPILIEMEFQEKFEEFLKKKGLDGR